MASAVDNETEPMNEETESMDKDTEAIDKEMAALWTSSDFHDDDNPLCEPCFDEDISLPADRFCSECKQYLCKKCTRHHGSLNATRHHTLLTVDGLHSSQPSSLLAKDKCSQTCSDHGDKTLKYFCETHSSFGCSVCITMSHKQCGEPVYIPKAAQDIRNDTGFRLFDKHLKTLESAYKASMVDVETMFEQLEEDDTKILQALELFRNQMNEALDQMEHDVTSKAKKIKHDETDKLKSLSDKLERSLGDVVELVTKMDNLLANGKHCDAYMLMKQEEAKLVSWNRELATITRGKTCQRCDFRPNTDMLKAVSLGGVLRRTETVSRDNYAISSLANPLADNTETEEPGAATGFSCSSAAPPSQDPQEIDWPAMGARMKVGARVCRGRDWSYLFNGNLDGNGPGTVVREERKRGRQYWIVSWDCGGKERGYLMGWKNYYQLKLL